MYRSIWIILAIMNYATFPTFLIKIVMIFVFSMFKNLRIYAVM